MSRPCGFKDTTTGYPCTQVVENEHDHCEAGHPCTPLKIMSDQVFDTTSAHADSLDVDELLHSGRADEGLSNSPIRLMKEYPKINSVFKRDERGRFLEGDWSCPEFEYLSDAPWIFTEKIDGTNTRVRFTAVVDELRYERPEFGRTNNAQMPVHLMDRLRILFDTDKMCRDIVVKAFNVDKGALPQVVLYGEGYGAKIQKGGQYIPDYCDFILFDVQVGQWWLMPEAVTDVAQKLGLDRVPIVGEFSLNEAIEKMRADSLQSHWPSAHIEGLVGIPTVQLFDRRGERIIAKVKVRDFR